VTGDVERRYRRWLLCYPRAYRRVRGEELVATLVATAPDGPTLPIRANVIRHGLRTRLGRPRSRAVVLWSVVAATIGGLFVAALASWAAWWTSPPPPDAAEARAILADVFTGHDLSEIYVPKSLFTIYGEPLSLSNVGTFLSFDGGEYGLSDTWAGSYGPPPMPAEQTLAMADRGLSAGGWHVYPHTVTDIMTCSGSKDCTPVPSTRTSVTARRGNTVLSFVDYADAGPETTELSVSLWRTAPPLVLPATIAGGVTGFILSWLVFAWASRRSAGTAPAVLCTIAMLCWWGPVVLAAPQAWHASRLADAVPVPLWEWLGQPSLAPLFVCGCGAAALALIVSWISRPPSPARTIA
jgi:hypothetical protein